MGGIAERKSSVKNELEDQLSYNTAIRLNQKTTEFTLADKECEYIITWDIECDEDD